MARPDEMYIITGGPSVGKTALVDAMGTQGFATLGESARAILQDQAAVGRGDVRADPILFGELMLAATLHEYRAALRLPPPVFLDRGVTELAAYWRYVIGAVPPHVDAAARRFRYATKVFIPPVWPEIFENDAERVQTLDEAHSVDAALVEIMEEYGYEVVRLPMLDIESRVDVVLREIGWLEFDDHSVGVRLRHPAGARIALDPDQRLPRLHVQGDDVYVEVTRLAGVSPQEEYDRHAPLLTDRFGADSVGPLRPIAALGRDGHAYDFAWPRHAREILVITDGADVLRVITDPAARLSAAVLSTLRIL